MHIAKSVILILSTVLTVATTYGQSTESYEISDTISFEGNYVLSIADYSSQLKRYIGYDFFTGDILQYTPEGRLIKNFESKIFIGGFGNIKSLGYYADSLIVVEGIVNTIFFDLNGAFIKKLEEDNYLNPGLTLLKNQHLAIDEELFMYRVGGYNTEFGPSTSQFYLDAKLVKQNIFNKSLKGITKSNFALYYPDSSVYKKQPGLYPAIYPQLLTTKDYIISIFPLDATVYYAAHNNLNEFKSKELSLTNFDGEIKYMDFGMGMDGDTRFKNEQLSPSIRKIFQTNKSDNYVIHYRSGIPKDAIVTKRSDSSISYALRDHYLHITDEHFNSIYEKDILLPPDIKKIAYVHSLDKILCMRFSKEDPEAQNQYYLLKLK